MASQRFTPFLRAIARNPTVNARRNISKSASNAQAVIGTEPIGTVGTIPVRKPVGGLRGGLTVMFALFSLLGFFFGFSLASAYASFYLLQEYKLASSLLQGSVEDLQESTSKMSNHLQRIEAVEKELKRLSSTSAVKEDVTKLRGEMKQVYDGLHVEVLDLRAHVWGVEQDLARSASHNSIRI
ncbi:hypothetical protein QFC22_004527 [Naganishia vaughanmartiniae]|uniref:Uncharacterized protein n=1 Tax=Naganishia vaughanmartiniae TaxID=1424756 RepID=A0ACC2WZX2_9TREE|nr:hypothetical protein QFC22_004527 [Naganishia vaughanmartiniae]